MRGARAVGHRAEQALRCCPAPPETLEGIAVDGKMLRGSRRQAAKGAHLLAAFSFLLTATAGQVSGGVVHDNELGAADAAEPSTAIGGRSIVIHK